MIFEQVIPGLGKSNTSKTFVTALGISKTRVKALNVPDQPCLEDDGAAPPDVSACITKFVEDKVGCRTMMVGTDEKRPGRNCKPMYHAEP